MAIDFKSDSGRKIVERLALQSDVLIENYVPGKLDLYGLGYEHLSKLNPRLIYLAVWIFNVDYRLWTSMKL
jgi:crotonobetainyl-CoA:carnitine CoA-transferase CaiB-like acyl-CoA transferase